MNVMARYGADDKPPFLPPAALPSLQSLRLPHQSSLSQQRARFPHTTASTVFDRRQAPPPTMLPRFPYTRLPQFPPRSISPNALSTPSTPSSVDSESLATGPIPPSHQRPRGAYGGSSPPSVVNVSPTASALVRVRSAKPAIPSAAPTSANANSSAKHASAPSAGQAPGVRPARTTRLFDDDDEIVRAKKQRRKEQCRINQANYRKRKRMQENKIEGEITVLEDEIESLEQAKCKAIKTKPIKKTAPFAEVVEWKTLAPIEQIGAFFVEFEQSVDAKASVRPDAFTSTAAASHYTLQHQEFRSMEQLLAQWRWYRSHFDHVRLEMQSTEQRHVDSHSILVVSCVLYVQLPWAFTQHEPCLARTQSRLACPVRLRFDINEQVQVLETISVEMDWIAAFMQLMPHGPLAQTLSLVHKLAVMLSMHERIPTA